MVNPPTDINAILAMLGAQNQSSSTTAQPGYSAPGAVFPAPVSQGSYPAHTQAYQPPASYPYPAPAASGSIDLSTIRPVTSGTVPIQDALAKAKAYAAEKGLTPYERPAGGYSPQENRPQYRRSRSRSPGRRDNYNPNPYRDERRDQASQNREFGRERSFSPGPRAKQGFSPRSSHGAARERSPLRGKDDNMEMIEVEASLVGLIIGRNGENLRRVEGESHCRVQFVPAAGPNDQQPRKCKISGPRPQREQAKEMINRIIQDSGMRQGGGDKGVRGGGGDSARAAAAAAAAANVPEGENSVPIMVPDRTVGLIIGRGGETIRDLQERSGCHINIVGENKSVNGLRPVNLIGTPAAARLAKELILEIVDSDTRNGGATNSRDHGGSGNRGGRNDNMGAGGYGGGGGFEKNNDSIYVPSDAVGMIIGKGGETIREMQTNTGCKINVSQSSGPGEVEREIGLVGSRDAIERAKAAIEEKVDAVRQKNNGGGGGGSGGGGGGGRRPPRDYDNPNYGQSSSNGQGQSMPSNAGMPSTGANGAADPYAMYGGYENYVAMWYQAQYAAQQAQTGDGGQVPPGTS